MLSRINRRIEQYYLKMILKLFEWIFRISLIQSLSFIYHDSFSLAASIMASKVVSTCLYWTESTKVTILVIKWSIFSRYILFLKILMVYSCLCYFLCFSSISSINFSFYSLCKFISSIRSFNRFVIIYFEQRVASKLYSYLF